jgi:ATP-binding cassette subfamily B protein RaxB
MAFFERRHIGDVLSRFGSLEMVLNIISRDLVEGLIDGLMMLGTLAMMFVYNSLLTLIPLIAILVYSAARFGFFFRLRARTEDFLVRSAREDSILIESIRGMLSLKVFNKDVERHQLWKGYYSDKVASHLAVQKNHNLFNGFESLLNGAEYVLVVFFGAVAVLHNHFSLGMLIAFLAYRTQFASKSKSFMQKLVDYKMLSLYLYRLSDIALADEEKNLNKPFPLQPEQIKGRIELQNISSRYTEGEPLFFENYSCTIEAGESVVLTGPSGCGKSTLLKIMMGLLKPSSGKVLIDGVELSEFGLRNYRSLIGAVMQEDKLFAGSIADNIAFFQPGYAQEEVEACAKLAAIHDSIIASTMGYQTLVGDMGAVLSGGQQQRILLARALFVQPKFLFLDEATSSLDKASESEVNNNIAKLGVTRVSIAHRQETIAMAGRQITLGA